VTDKLDSYVCGISEAPLLGDTIGRSLDRAAQRWGNREALVSPSHGVRWTWAELARRVDDLAAGFLALGLERGARIGVWQAKSFPGISAFGPVGTPSYFELITRDYAKSVAFYTDVCGWQPEVAGDTDEFRLSVLKDSDGETIAGIMDGAGFLPPDAVDEWQFYIQVAGTDAALAKVTELGGTVAQPGIDTPYGRLAAATDPTGAPFKLVGPAGEGSA